MELNAQVNIHPESLTKKQALGRTKEWAVKNIEIANSVPNGAFSIILLLTIIDSFAQAEYDYPPVNESSITFQKFVLSHTESQRKHLKKTMSCYNVLRLLSFIRYKRITTHDW